VSEKKHGQNESMVSDVR